MKLGPKEQQLYDILTAVAGVPHSKYDLIDALWGAWSDATDNALVILIHKLRRKLGDDSIKTVRGFGYVYLPASA